ncbi:MAG: hypothetical protein JW953_08240 [Anaerolineae bacterium]|nr:hypothetical protein [Anaerolineae bacterium]
MTYIQEKQVAIEAVTRAARLCQMVRAEMVVDALEKDDRSPVTVADFGSQALICYCLQAAFPQELNLWCKEVKDDQNSFAPRP